MWCPLVTGGQACGLWMEVWTQIPTPSSSASSKRRPGASLLIFEMLFFSLNPKGTLELAKQVSSLPLVNYNLLRYICK